MVRPVQITCRNIESSQEAKRWVQEEAAKLDRCNPRITSCRVALEVPHAHREWGRIYRVQVDIGVPGGELVVRLEPTLRALTRKAIGTRPAKRLQRENRSKDLHLGYPECLQDCSTPRERICAQASGRGKASRR